jgi:hypothetical protein
MKTLSILILFISFCSSFAQTKKPVNDNDPNFFTKKLTSGLQRNVFFTLNKNEVVYSEEYTLNTNLNGKNFAAVVFDTIANTYSIIINNKRIYVYNNSDSYGSVTQLNLSKDNGYIIWKYKGENNFCYNVFGEEICLETSGSEYRPIGIEERENGNYFSYNSKEFGPFQKIKTKYTENNILTNGSNNFMFSFQRNDKWFLNVNNIVYGPFEEVYNERLTADKKFAFTFYNDSKYFDNVNGKNYFETYYAHYSNKELTSFESAYKYLDGSYCIELKSSDGNHKLRSTYEQNNVVIDGVQYGKNPAIRAYYSEKQNAFVWLTQEGRDLVVYQFKF